jgi:HD-GYP domain-containing protein (c-di-GMP phosphodiesterase class II)
MKKHPEIGSRILSRVRQIKDLLPGVLHHHARVDGRGYPSNLAGRDIPLLGRIICLADCFDAMTTDRTYRAAMPLATVIGEIRRCAGTQFDPELAEVFLRMDLERMLKEAHEYAGANPSIGQVGALNAVVVGARCGNRGKQAPEAASDDVPQNVDPMRR